MNVFIPLFSVTHFDVNLRVIGNIVGWARLFAPTDQMVECMKRRDMDLANEARDYDLKEACLFIKEKISNYNIEELPTDESIALT